MDNEGQGETQVREHSDCPLSYRQQTRNILIYASAAWMNYLGSPVTYIAIQAAMLHDLGASTTVANLPAIAYFSMTFMPLLIAWYLPYISFLKWNIVACYTAMTASVTVVVAMLIAPVSNDWKIWTVIIQAGVMGIALNSAGVFMWEMMGRGVAECRRGSALGLTFGAGPLLAVAASLFSQLMLTGELFGLSIPVPAAPYNYMILYGVTGPMMGLVAVSACFIVVPRPKKELVREPLWAGVFGGLESFGRDRVLLIAALAIILFYTANTVISNMILYTEFVLGAPPSDYVGWQNTLRFGAKAIGGLGLGWLLTRTNPRTTMLTTAGFFLAGQLCAMIMPGPAYLAAFVFYGVGELIGVYGPNYILSASHKRDYRRNMAIIMIVSAPTAFTGYVFGAIAEYFQKRGRPDIGFPLSFALCAILIIVGIVMVIAFLPRRPAPHENGAVVPERQNNI